MNSKGIKDESTSITEASKDEEMKEAIERASREASVAFWMHFKNIRSQQMKRLKAEHMERARIGTLLRQIGRESVQDAAKVSKSIAAQMSALNVSTEREIGDARGESEHADTKQQQQQQQQQHLDNRDRLAGGQSVRLEEFKTIEGDKQQQNEREQLRDGKDDKARGKVQRRTTTTTKTGNDVGNGKLLGSMTTKEPRKPTERTKQTKAAPAKKQVQANGVSGKKLGVHEKPSQAQR